MLGNMVINIDIDLEDVVDGYSYGHSIYEDYIECEFLLRPSSVFNIQFSSNIVDISDSFILGFFEVIYNEIGILGIDKNFNLECAGVDDLKDKVMNVLSNSKYD